MTSVAASIAGILLRELTTLRREVEAYPSDADLWRVVPGISNSGGTLAVHLAGNLEHFVGAVLGGSGYLRDRDAEFAVRDLPRAEVVARVNRAIAAIERSFREIEDARLRAEYPEPVAKMRVNTGDFLIHLASHLSYHLGQVDYHRRITTGGAALGGAVSPTRLRSAVPAG